MAKSTLTLPVIQNWSCHNCGGCCREHLIEITTSEKQRIERQNWTLEDGIPSDRPLIESMGHNRFRLAHQNDGACVFLNSEGLCRIHAKFGEAAKPLACRVYPYAFHPIGTDVTVSLRFSCPSVVQNLGKRVIEQRTSLQQLASEIVGDSKVSRDPPPVHHDQQLDWSDFRRFLQTFEDTLSDDSVDFATQLMRILSWLELVEKSQFSTIRGERLQQYLSLITRAAEKAQPDSDLPILRPSLMGRLMFRQLVAQLLRHDTEQTARGGLVTRLRLLNAALKFTFATGRVPILPEPISVSQVFGSAVPEAATTPRSDTRFKDLEVPFGGRSLEIDRLMVRYFRVKIQGLHFCGPANFDLSLVEGFRSLALMYPATMWVARFRAASAGRSSVQLADVQAALATVDHNFGYSAALGTASAIRRLKILGQLQQVTRLCGWYSR